MQSHQGNVKWLKTSVQLFFENLFFENIVLKTSFGFRFVNHLKQMYDSIVSKIETKCSKGMPTYFYLGDDPFFGPAVSCPEINDQILGKISKNFSSVL